MSPVFEVANLRKAFGGLAVTNDVSLTMLPGDRIALIGPKRRRQDHLRQPRDR
ncbi:ABC-type branched-subunit amino acid transport system ATPase component [Rhizobium leguminosarum]